MRRVAASTCAGLAVAALAACGGLDTAKVEEQTKRAVAREIGVEVRSVSCPDDVPAEKGETFRCRVVAADRSSGDVQVTQKDDEGDVAIEVPFVRTRESEQAIRSGAVDSDERSDRVDCPDIRVVKRGDTYDCRAFRDGRETSVRVTQLDERGNLSFDPTRQAAPPARPVP